jgi:hypothetical protein
MCRMSQHCFFHDKMIIPHESNTHAHREADLPQIGRVLQTWGGPHGPPKMVRAISIQVTKLKRGEVDGAAFDPSEVHSLDVTDQQAFKPRKARKCTEGKI